MSETGQTLFQFKNGSKSYGGRVLFDKATFSINEDEHVGVIGPNGAGKSTLFRILAGEEELDVGEVVKARGLKMAYLRQHDDWALEETVEHYLQSRCELPLWDLKSFGRKLGLEQNVFDKKMAEFSGGYRMRVKLLALFGQNPDLMLLDEPTNYLDLETLIVLEKFLLDFKGAFLVISHDREFLRRVTDHTVEVEDGDIEKFNGNIDDYFEQKEMIRTQLEKTAANQAQKRAQIQAFIDRFRAKATKAKQAQARMKMLDRMETIEVRSLPGTAVIKIPPPELREGKLVLQLSNANAGYGERTILSQVNLRINAGDKIGVVGFNGAGKSTLLKALSGELALLSGQKELGHNSSFGLYAQHVSERLDLNRTVVEELEAATSSSITRQDVLDMAGSLLFSGADVEKGIRVLSGGERARVALGKILLSRAACLILDEPTNHLDFYTVEALTESLMRFPGTLITVSHDRGFIRRVATKILEIRDGQCLLYPGTYDEYVWSVQNQVNNTDSDSGFDSSSAPDLSARTGVIKGAFPSSSSGVRIDSSLHKRNPAESTSQGAEDLQSGPRRYELKKNCEARLRQLDKRLPQVEDQLSHLQKEVDALLNEISLASPDKLRELSAHLTQKQAELAAVEEEWLKLEEEKLAKTEELEKLKG